MIQPQKAPSAFKPCHYRCGICGKGLRRRNGDDLYCGTGDVISRECECKEVKAKESYLDDLVLRELKSKLKRVMDAEELKLKRNSSKASAVDGLHSLESALESSKRAKQMLFEKLADRSIDRETFRAKKQEYDDEIAALEQKISDARMAEQLLQESTDESRSKVETAKSFLDLKDMTEDAWKTFVEEVIVYPGYRIEIHWSFEA